MQVINSKKWWIVAVMVVVVPLMLGSCAKKKDPNVAYYTCAMHPQIHMDHPGRCPICGMTLIPVMKDAKSESTMSGIYIAPDRLSVLGVKVVPVEKKDLVDEIRTSGTIANSPELAVAQEEYLASLSLSGVERGQFVAAARNKLKLMGMTDDWIRNLAHQRHPEQELYLPKQGGKVIVEAALYEYQLPHISVGQEAHIGYPNGMGGDYVGKVIGIDPVVNPMTRTVRAWIEVSGDHGPVKAGTYLVVRFQEKFGPHLAVPKTAVLDTGKRQIVVVDKDNHFEPRQVKLGMSTPDEVAVESGLSEGEMVVSAANFLIDSEAQLKTQLDMSESHH